MSFRLASSLSPHPSFPVSGTLPLPVSESQPTCTCMPSTCTLLLPHASFLYPFFSGLRFNPLQSCFREHSAHYVFLSCLLPPAPPSLLSLCQVPSHCLSVSAGCISSVPALACGSHACCCVRTCLFHDVLKRLSLSSMHNDSAILLSSPCPPLLSCLVSGILSLAPSVSAGASSLHTPCTWPALALHPLAYC